MKKNVILCMLLMMCFVACNKELGRSIKKENAPHLNVTIGTVDNSGEPATTGPDIANSGNGDESGTGISASEQNQHSIYTFMGVSGLYFGCSSIFKTDKESLEFIFGTGMTTNLAFTREEFEQLIRNGERQFGSLGAFTSFPQRYSNKVEIGYTDKQGRRWCSTRISERKTDEGVETTVKIEQDGSFMVEEAHKIEIAAETEGYLVKGRFECTLYKVNGNAKRKLKGDFTGIVAPQ